MDPGTILAVVQISAKVLSIITKYYSDVRKAKADVECLASETKAYTDVLALVQKSIDDAHRLFPGASAAAVAVEQSLRDLQSLEQTLSPTSGKKAMRSFWNTLAEMAFHQQGGRGSYFQA